MTTEEAIENFERRLPFMRRYAANLERARIYNAATSLRRQIKRLEKCIARLKGEEY